MAMKEDLESDIGVLAMGLKEVNDVDGMKVCRPLRSFTTQ